MIIRIGYSTYDFGKWIHTVDNDADMLRCPKCNCGIRLEPYTRAIGTAGTAFCPYCGEDLRNDQMSIIDGMLSFLLEGGNEKM